MLGASHGQNNRILGFNNQVIVYGTRLFGFMPVRMLAFHWFDDHRKTITGCPRAAWHGAARAGKAISRGDWNHPKDGVLRWRSWRAHVNALSSTEGIGKGWSRIPKRRAAGCPVETHFWEVETRRVAPKPQVSGMQREHREPDGGLHWRPSLFHLPMSDDTIAVGLAARSLVRIASDNMKLAGDVARLCDVKKEDARLNEFGMTQTASENSRDSVPENSFHRTISWVR